jgi:hypothetical protein
MTVSESRAGFQTSALCLDLARPGPTGSLGPRYQAVSRTRRFADQRQQPAASTDTLRTAVDRSIYSFASARARLASRRAIASRIAAGATGYLRQAVGPSPVLGLEVAPDFQPVDHLAPACAAEPGCRLARSPRSTARPRAAVWKRNAWSPRQVVRPEPSNPWVACSASDRRSLPRRFDQLS